VRLQKGIEEDRPNVRVFLRLSILSGLGSKEKLTNHSSCQEFPSSEWPRNYLACALVGSCKNCKMKVKLFWSFRKFPDYKARLKLAKNDLLAGSILSDLSQEYSRTIGESLPWNPVMVFGFPACPTTSTAFPTRTDTGRGRNSSSKVTSILGCIAVAKV
jgi:hypothetical protein